MAHGVLRGADGVKCEEIAYLDAPATLGTCQTILPAGPWAYFDEASTLGVLLLGPEDELGAVSLRQEETAVAAAAFANTACGLTPLSPVRVLDCAFEKYRNPLGAVACIAEGGRWLEGPVWFGDASQLRADNGL